MRKINDEDLIKKLFYVAMEAEGMEQFTNALEKVEQEKTGY
ncbi:hypothetical protein [Desulfallas thermosapovorans]|uniref:Uncharacterized protein n=1 Tax=Desulfallas thermosapovorans DSM 6562 TaxID=1121431 RepID=A0A5S4ZQR8_9FIRM|nr:hypothetical protein [Desulfallas thermosapovorans]TYO94422.1 hypothetical protein LX24_02406 [Desulfallas thermosapovorans DSM 6562]